MKVLYVAHFGEQSNWSHSAIHRVLSLQNSDVDVVCKNIPLQNGGNNIPEFIENLTKKDTQNIDVCIQHVLPNMVIGTKKFKKNILCAHIDTEISEHHPWYHYLNMVDEVWVNNKDSLENLTSIGITAKYIPMTFNTDLYQNVGKKIDLGDMNNKFKFYFSSPTGEKNNLNALIRTYLSEFDGSDNVCFVFNVYDTRHTEEEMKNYFSDYIHKNKEAMRVHKNHSHFPPVFLITKPLNILEQQSLHASCDCYVDLTKSRDFSITGFEAMCHGKTPICSNIGGYKDFVKQDSNIGQLINGVSTICFDPNPPVPNLYKSNEFWFSPDEKESKKAMRWYYENKDSINRTAGIDVGKEFDYKVIGKQMKESLNE